MWARAPPLGVGGSVLALALLPPGVLGTLLGHPPNLAAPSLGTLWALAEAKGAGHSPKHKEACTQQPGEDPWDRGGHCDDVVPTVLTYGPYGGGIPHPGEHCWGWGREAQTLASFSPSPVSAAGWALLQVLRAPLHAWGPQGGLRLPLTVPFPTTHCHWPLGPRDLPVKTPRLPWPGDPGNV